MLRSAEAMMNEATSEVGGYGRFAGGGDFEWHFEEGEVCGLTNRRLFLGRRQVGCIRKHWQEWFAWEWQMVGVSMAGGTVWEEPGAVPG